MPLIALTIVLILLFPVISVSDDLGTLQNPAESDTCYRRSLVAHDLVLPCPVAALASLLALIQPESRHISVSSDIADHIVEVPALDGIENRPPPAA